MPLASALALILLLFIAAQGLHCRHSDVAHHQPLLHNMLRFSPIDLMVLTRQSHWPCLGATDAHFATCF